MPLGIDPKVDFAFCFLQHAEHLDADEVARQLVDEEFRAACAGSRPSI